MDHEVSLPRFQVRSKTGLRDLMVSLLSYILRASVSQSGQQSVHCFASYFCDEIGRIGGHISNAFSMKRRSVSNEMSVSPGSKILSIYALAL